MGSKHFRVHPGDTVIIRPSVFYQILAHGVTITERILFLPERWESEVDDVKLTPCFRVSDR